MILIEIPEGEADSQRWNGI